MRTALLLLVCLVLPARATFSIVAYDPATESWGVAVQSKFLGVGSVVPWARAGQGAVATQALANTTYGPRGLALMATGVSASNVVARLTEADPRAARRQVGMVDTNGLAAAFTGAGCFAWAGHRIGTNYCVQGNILAGEAVVADMAEAFEEARAGGEGDLADWMLAALEAGQAAGGDRRGRQSAALLVVKEAGGYGGHNDRYIDIRIDDHRAPIQELGRLLRLHRRFHRLIRTR